MRVVFVTNGLGLGRTRVRPEQYFVFAGKKLTTLPDYRYIPDAEGVMKLVLDGRRIAYWNPLSNEWQFAWGRRGKRHLEGKRSERVYCAQRMYVDDLPYTLEGREWGGATLEGGHDEVPAPCVFCGKKVWHMNEPRGRGTAWALTATFKGVAKQYLHCNTVGCNNEHVWDCVDCGISNLGPRCHECHKARAAVDREAALLRGENV